MRSLTEYRETLERIGSGTVSVEFAREMLDAAEREVAKTVGEYTITQAVEMSGRSRSWFERHVERFAAEGLARKLGNVWLVKGAAIPRRGETDAFDPAMDVDSIADRLVAGL